MHTFKNSLYTCIVGHKPSKIAQMVYLLQTKNTCTPTSTEKPLTHGIGDFSVLSVKGKAFWLKSTTYNMNHLSILYASLSQLIVHFYIMLQGKLFHCTLNVYLFVFVCIKYTKALTR